MKLAIFCLPSLLVVGGAGLPGSSPGAAVHTSQGLVIGHAASNRTQVNEFLGIPFALPPVGDLRFGAPLKYNKSETYIASNFVCSVSASSVWHIETDGPSSHRTDERLRGHMAGANLSVNRECPFTPSRPFIYPNQTAQGQRIISNFADENNFTQSEDCLTLNIWSKATKKKNKPVLVFFYGGRWSIGATNTAYYDGQYLAAAEDVVVVTLNYRLGIFGFSGAPGLTQNVGLLDQRLAVEWVRDNIEAFGGCRSKIVIVGQSSGSVAVDYWSYAYVKDPIVHGLISHSGNVFSFPINSNQLAAQHWYNASATLGCGTSGDVLACMRSKNITAIKAAAALVKPPPNTSQARSQPVFQPTPDNISVFADYVSLSYGGHFAKLPYLNGNNDYEAGYYKIPAYAQGVTLDAAAWDEFNLEDFTCPTSTESANRAKYNVPVWRFRYFADWDNLRLYTNPSSGAYHGSDLEMVIGASQDVSGLPESAPEMQLQAEMMRAWATFADDPARGLSKVVSWPKYDPSKPTLIRLGYNNSPVVNFASPALYDTPCAALNLSFYGL